MVKYYYAGSQRVAVRTGSTLKYLLGDHLGSTAITVGTGGAFNAELHYKACPLRCVSGVLREGENRYTNGSTPTTYRYTGQKQEAYTLADQTVEYQPTAIPGNRPITLGHLLQPASLGNGKQGELHFILYIPGRPVDLCRCTGYDGFASGWSGERGAAGCASRKVCTPQSRMPGNTRSVQALDRATETDDPPLGRPG